MRFSIILVLAGAVSVVAAKPETNAQRLTRGLPPLPPARRATPVDGMLPFMVQLVFH